MAYQASSDSFQDIAAAWFATARPGWTNADIIRELCEVCESLKTAETSESRRRVAGLAGVHLLAMAGRGGFSFINETIAQFQMVRRDDDLIPLVPRVGPPVAVVVSPSTVQPVAQTDRPKHPVGPGKR